MSHTHDVLRRLLHILESGRALNGISNDRATVYAGALREILESPQPSPADARIDVEALLRACVPGGDICDPQRIADSIREWFDDHGAQADAPAEARELPMMRKAFRVTEVSGDPDPAKQRFYMRFSFPSIEALHAADDEWKKFIAAAPAEARELALTQQHLDAITAAIDMLERRAWSNDQYMAAKLRELIAGGYRA